MIAFGKVLKINYKNLFIKWKKTYLSLFIILIVLMSISIIALSYGVNVNLSFTPGVVMNLPDEVEGWVGNELRFCHNPNEFGEKYHNESYFLRDLDNPKKCPKCNGELFNCTLAEKEQLPLDTEFVKSAYTNQSGSFFTYIYCFISERLEIVFIDHKDV